MKAVFTAGAGFANSTLSDVTVTDAQPENVATTTTVTEPDSAEVGVGVNISVQVSPTPTGGTVQFQDGGVNIGGPVEVDSSGSTTLSQHAFTPAGPRSITATYSGAAGFEGSTSAARSINVTEPVRADVETETALTVPSTATVGEFDVTAEFSGVEGFKDSSSTVSTVNVTGGDTGGGTSPAGSLGAMFGSLGG